MAVSFFRRNLTLWVVWCHLVHTLKWAMIPVIVDGSVWWVAVSVPSAATIVVYVDSSTKHVVSLLAHPINSIKSCYILIVSPCMWFISFIAVCVIYSTLAVLLDPSLK